jgi:uncharacterized protein with PQ loop repeat
MVHHTHKHIHHKEKKEPIDYIIRFFMIATPLAELPQAYTIYSEQSADHVSPFTWVFFTLSSVVWLCYAAKLKSLPLLVAYSLYMVIEITIVIGIFTYS